MARPLSIIIFVSSVLAGCGGTRSLAARLPANNEIDTWTLDGSPVVADSDTDLYSQIDGAAPKYIDRGWVGCVYAVYRQGANLVQVAIHDMGSSDNALALFNFDLPISRVQIDGLPNAVFDMGLYTAEAYAGQYVIEVSITDDGSDPSLDTVRRFVRAILKRCE